MGESNGPVGNQICHIQPHDGPLFWGPGDRYRFLITGKQSGGAYFIVECLVPPGGGPPLHAHLREEECFFLLEGQLAIVAGDRTIDAGPGDFVHFPRGVQHSYRNTASTDARMLAIFSPAGMEGWFQEALDVATDPVAMPPPPSPAMIARMLDAGPRFAVAWGPPPA